MALSSKQPLNKKMPPPATTFHGKGGGVSVDGGVKKNDGRNMTRPVTNKDNALARHQNPGHEGRSVSGTNIQKATPVIGGNPNQGRHQFRADGPAPATTAHGKTPSPARPDNGNARGALPSAGWKGSGAPNTGRGAASPGMKSGKGKTSPLSGPQRPTYAPS
jgi:hypothetical protein